jgi:hypothetical protein
MRTVCFDPTIVEPKAVDNRPVRIKPKDAWSHVPELWLGRDGAGLDEAEAKPGQFLDRNGILVEPGGEADWIGEAQPESLNGERRMVGAAVLSAQA